MTALDEAVLRNMGDEALGILTACWYSAEIDNPINQKFVAGVPRRLEVRPRLLRRGDLHRGAVLEATLQAVKGNIEDKPAFMKAVRAIKVDTCRGPVSFDAVRQRGRQRLHPQGRAQGRPARQRGDPHLSEREPVLDLQARGVPEEPGVLARLPAGEEPRRSLTRARRAADVQFWVDPDAEQPGAGRAAVPAGGRVLADLRPDADRQPHARRAASCSAPTSA